MKNILLFLTPLILTCTSANSEDIKFFDNMKNVYVDREYNREVEFLCNSFQYDKYLNTYLKNHISEFCRKNIKNFLTQECQKEVVKLYEEALCLEGAVTARATLQKANKILQEHPSWGNAVVWQTLDSGANRGCYVGYIKQLADKIKYCK